MAPKKSQKRQHPSGPSSSSSLATPWAKYGVVLTNPTHQQIFTTLETRKIKSTRFLDWGIIDRLGIRNDVDLLCERIGWEVLAHLPPEDTYKRLTLEFLSTLGRSEDEEGVCLVHFQLFNQQFTKTFIELDNVFGWDDDAPLAQDVTNEFVNFNETQVWTLLTGEPAFDARHDKASRLVHPAVRLIHRLMVFCIYGRTEVGAMSPDDMKPLWLLTQPRKNPIPIDFAEHFIMRMGMIRDGINKSDILMGGMVTHLAKRFCPNADFSTMIPVGGGNGLTDSVLQTMDFYVKVPGSNFYKFRVRNEIFYRLPNPDYMSIANAGHENPFFPPRQLLEQVGGRQILQPQQEQQQFQQQQPQPHIPPQPHIQPRGEGPSSSSSSFSFDLGPLGTALMHEMQNQGFYSQAIYGMHVERGDIQPYVNYPYHPPQQGPVPGWHNRQPTYPYWPQRPEGLDYRYPGGSDPSLDPNIPPFYSYPAYPDNYHSSVPRMKDSWGGAPMPPYGNYPMRPNYDWPPYTDASGDDVDPNYNTTWNGPPSPPEGN